MGLTPEQRESRLRFDFEVCSRIWGDVISGAAHRTSADLERHANPITSINDGHLATKYLVAFKVPTLVGPDRFQDVTTIGFDLSTGNYPFTEPATWIVGPEVPWSPHFRRGSPVCIGEMWRESGGKMLLAQLIVHVAKLLNWDEVARGGGYVGWNGQAVDYHRKKYGGKPLNQDIKYPALPTELTHGLSPSEGLFRPSQSTGGAFGAADGMFSPAGGRR